MNRHGHLGPAVWPYFVAVACLLLVMGCQDGSGPNLVTSPEGKPDYDAVKPPPPPPPPPPADPAIAFVITGKGRGSQTNWFLKVMNADGTNLTTILTSSAAMSTTRPSWSPGGDTIAFVRYPGELWLIDVSVINGVPTGSNARLLVSRTENRIVQGQVDWAPSGDQIVFASYNPSLPQRSLQIVSASGGDPVQTYLSAASLSQPVWSPEARRIAFTEDAAVRVLNLDDGSVTTVLQENTVAAWAKTQDVLAFTAEAPGGGVGIYTMPLPSGPRTFICAGQTTPDWSPDDGALVFRIGSSIMKVQLNTGVITPLLSSDGPDYPRPPVCRRF